MHDNICLVRDLWDVCEIQQQYPGLFFIDQEKAFDSVNHEYLFYILKQFGFVSSFISCVTLLYNHIFSLIKVNDGLCLPLRIGRGIRQGCPLSGILYSLCMESLLIRLRSSLMGFPVTPSEEPVIVSAYADDVCVAVRSNNDITMLFECLHVYSQACTTQINWSKCKAVWVGCTPPSGLPTPRINLTWVKEGVKYLSVYLGTPGLVKKELGWFAPQN